MCSSWIARGISARASHPTKNPKLAFLISESAAEKTRINGGLALVITAALLRSASTAIHPAFRITSRQVGAKDPSLC